MPELRPGHVRMIVDPQHFAYETGVALRGLSYLRKDNGWQTILRGQRRDGSFVYSLLVAVELEASITGLLELLRSKEGQRYWYPDKFANKPNLK